MKKTYNTFNGGLVLDYHPLSVPNNVLTDALNGTIITMNGNEAILQNDMGNGRVENAFLPPGYVPVGVKEHGGIIYIASYNPLTNKGLLGSFPSPERNIDFNEIDNRDGVTVTLLNGTQSKKFLHFNDEVIGINGFQDKALLFEEPIRSGDKFALYFSNTRKENLSYLNFGSNRKLVNLYIQVLDANNNLRDITEDLKIIPETGYFIGNEPITADKLKEERDKSKYLNTYNNKLFGKLFLVGKVNTIEYIEVSTEIEVTPANNLVVTWTVNYYYKCDKKYLDTPIIDYKVGNGTEQRIPRFAIGAESVYKDDLYVRTYKANATIPNKEGYLYFRVIPQMKFPNNENSKLVNIAEEGSINLALIGTGEINLNRWNYRYLDNALTLNYGFEADVSGLYTYKNLKFTCSLIGSPYAKAITIKIPDKNSYNGVFTEVFSQLSPGKIYKVLPTIDRYNKSETNLTPLKLQKKLIITTNIYNDLFREVLDYCADENKDIIQKHNTIQFTNENKITLSTPSHEIKDVPYQGDQELSGLLPFYSPTRDSNIYSLKRENIFHFSETIVFQLGLDKDKYPFKEVTTTAPDISTFNIQPNIGTLEISPDSRWDKDTSTYIYKGTITIPKKAEFTQSVSTSLYVLNKYENICLNFISQLNGQCFITPVFAMWEGRNEIQINLIKTNTIGENPVSWDSSKQVFVDTSAGHMGTKSLSEFSFLLALSNTLNKTDAPFIFTSLNNINDQYDRMQTNDNQKDYLKLYTDDPGKDCTRVNTSLFNDEDIKNESLIPYGQLYVNQVAEGLTDPKANGTKANYWYYLFIKDTAGNYVILNVCNRTEKVYISIKEMINALLGGLNIYYKTDEPVSKEFYKQEITSKEDSSVEELFLENKINSIRITSIDNYTLDPNSPNLVILDDADFCEFLTFPIDTTNIAINSETKNITVNGFENFNIDNLKGIIEEDNVVTDNSGNPLTKSFYYYNNEEGVDGKDPSKLTDRLTIENGNILVKYNLSAIDTKKTFAVGDKKDGTYHNTSVKVKNKLFKVLFLPDYFDYINSDLVKEPKLEKLVD